ncbi:SYG1 (YIL047C) [Zygosaccharomyces parabailii]|uniref:BN860_01508g1_1 n=1 Tax=Zygosaccharomyces bailii (strain CLIB 213 / ATCC 58445 / CBS 680 / BCRC 21525 / NBRC 1098 / NCYC 1416 / NRRL Y-2227) TaxID=1333698 RepID=A0A8J2T383_ZYGB2|nr:SYG1 (YIL047C) [Zygosaccharomyces parabailii]CDF88066.1 BN860_01508g1_1 [Zygosaccharomyces bailii CLIB 213]SJM87374.1 related to protein SYG1 [Zygosaccharomyces bailii]
MKFGDHLNESAVPEWRNKYIDYKFGKKKLKECKKVLDLESKPWERELSTSSNLSYLSHQSLRSRSGNPSKNYSLLQRQCIKAFLQNWLIETELKKANDFYLWLLEQSKKTFLVLQQQLSIYSLQRDHEAHLLQRLPSPFGVTPKKYGSIGGLGQSTSAVKTYFEKWKHLIDKHGLWPSWPKGLTNVWNNLEKNHRGRETFNRACLPVTAAQAEKLLGEALIDFYNYLQLVKTFRDLNVTAFRKMIKKFDKICKTEELASMMQFAKNNYPLFKHVDINVALMTQRMQKTTSAQATGKVKLTDENEDPIIFWETQVTEWYTKDLVSSNSAQKRHNKRLKKLSVQYTLNEQMIHRNNRAIVQMFFSGIGIGISATLITYTLYLSFFYRHDFTLHKILFPLWGGWYLILMLATLFQLDCFIWHRIGINYRFIMLGEFHSKNGTQLFNNDFATSAISLQLYFLTFFVVSCAICAVISFHWASLSPCGFIYLGIVLFLFVCPNGLIPYWNKVAGTRKWLIVTLFRLIFSGFYPVEFGDFFIGDIVSSLTYSMSDIATFFCVYSSTPNSQCGSSHSKAVGIMACLPSYWRFMQCLRRFSDSGDWFPHLLNAGKYMLGIIYYGLLCAYRLSGSHVRGPFIVFAALYAFFAAAWDLVMDWSLFQTTHQNWMLREDLYLAGKRNWKTGRYSLRGKLIYYLAMIWDVAIRFQWIVYAVAPKTMQQSAKTSFILALTEAGRRFVWIIFRVENEHVANVHLFKVNGELPLPYPVYEGEETPDPIKSDTISLSHLAMSLKEPIAAYHSMLRRRTGTFDSLSKSIPWAHASDFERPPTFTSDQNVQDTDSESEMESVT